MSNVGGIVKRMGTVVKSIETQCMNASVNLSLIILHIVRRNEQVEILSEKSTKQRLDP